MSALFFQNGVSIGTAAGWCGYTGSNNYVVRYDFVTGAEGADSLSLSLSGIYYGSAASSQGFGFKVSSSSVAYANARNMQPDSGYGVMSYSPATGYGCTLSASGLNLAPNSLYYIFVFVATAGAEYYSGWNCVSPAIVCSGSYTPPAGSIGSYSRLVDTGSAFSLTLGGSPAAYHRAVFSHGGSVLGSSAVFTASLSHICPREWLSRDTSAQSMEIDVSLQGYSDGDCLSPKGETMACSFTLRADSGMRPVLSAAALSLEALNTAAGFTEFIAGISRARVRFDTAGIDLSSCAGAGIAGFALSCGDRRIEGEGPELETEALSSGSSLCCIVIDSRGREGSISLSPEILPYVPPSLTEMEAQRCNADGSDHSLGEYFKIRARRACTELGGKNSAHVSVNIRPGGGDWGEETALEGFEDAVWSNEWASPTLLGGAMQGDSYTLALTVSDLVGCASRYSLGLYHQRWAMKFNEKGTAVGFGMEPGAENAVQLPDSWRLYAGALVLSENSYGYEEPETAVQAPVQGQLYFLISE